jgi:hypothetical protein
MGNTALRRNVHDKIEANILEKAEAFIGLLPVDGARLL